MANTFPKKNLRLRVPGNSYMSYAVRAMPEGASQTFIAGAPVVVTAGLIVEAADPATAVYGFALRAGQNGSGKTSEVVPCIDGVEIFANFLNSGGTTTNALAAADLDNADQFELQTNDVGGSGTDEIWHVADTSGTDAMQMVSFETDHFLPNVVNNAFAAVGDLNARVCFVVDHSIRTYNAVA